MKIRLIALSLCLASHAWAAKVIMRDGKIYEGKIIAETDGDVLIKTSPVSRSKLLLNDEILSVVRDPKPVETRDPQRYASVEAMLSGNAFTSDQLSLDPAAGIWLGGGIRLHPLIELGAGFDWKPAMSGELAISDGTTLRTYERFLSYGGGFSAHLYPFFQKKDWRIEPFLIVGYEWSRLVPKDSGDALKGQGMKGGLGVHGPMRKNLFWEARFVYRRIVYDRIFFLLREGEPNPAIDSNGYALSIGISYHI